jgi:hypothetical protein
MSAVEGTMNATSVGRRRDLDRGLIGFVSD